MPKDGKLLALGIEGSANKCGVGIVTEDGTILSNPRHTWVLWGCGCGGGGVTAAAACYMLCMRVLWPHKAVCLPAL